MTETLKKYLLICHSSKNETQKINEQSLFSMAPSMKDSEDGEEECSFICGEESALEV